MDDPDDVEAAIDAISRIDAVQAILDVICLSTGMGFAAIARVTEDRWVACRVRDTIDFGLKPGSELNVEATFCNGIRQNRIPVVIDDMANDAQYKDHPISALYSFQSYISVPIVMPGGIVFGTLCGLDRKPARVNTPQTIGMFKLFADLIALQLQADRRLAARDASLLDERRSSELREQFIAVLGHDLRNPLAAINSGMRMIAKTPLNDKATGLVAMVQNSVSRMAGLIDNVLDFARGRLGDGLTLTRARCDLAPVLHQVVEELRTSQPDRPIETEFLLPGAIDCDPRRLSQIVSNLVANALTHGAADTPVRVRATVALGFFELSVSNAGPMIPAATLARLFQPFERGSVQPSQHGLGLGLYIASQIARAHGGTLSATSSSAQTRFVFRMPLADSLRDPPQRQRGRMQPSLSDG